MRRKKAEKRISTPDFKYNDILIGKLVKAVMEDGKKQVAQGIVYNALDIIAEKTGGNPIDTFRKAINNVQPAIEVRSRRVGGANYQVPTEVRPERRVALAMKWLLLYARMRNDKSMASKLANELLSASNSEGGAVKKKEDVHRMAEANKAFSHFRF